MEALTLSGAGLAVALVMGVLFVAVGGQAWWVFIVGMLLFLVLSAIVTRLGNDYKRKKRLGQDPRGVANVVANGAVPLAMAFLYRLALGMGAERYALLCFFGFIASVAAITADKFASEIGVLGPMPVSLISRRRVRKGISGGVTWLGLAVSALAAVLIGVVLVSLSISYGLSVNPYLAIGIVMVCGFSGSLADSVLGYYEEKGIGNKFTSNLVCSIVGASLGVVLILIL